MSAASSTLSNFCDTYHLWYFIVFLCATGLYHLIGDLIHWSFRLCADAHEEYYAFLERCEENRRRYRHVTERVGGD